MSDTVFVAAALWDRHPEVYDTIQVACAENDIGFRTIHGTPNIWCRDYMPLQVGNKFINFQYKKYGINGSNKRFPSLDVPAKVYESTGKTITSSRLVLDGGNVVRHGHRVIATDMLFKHNHCLDRAKVLAKLEEKLEAEVIIIPSEPGDPLGHSDGIVKWINDDTVFINDYSVASMYKNYQETLHRTLMHRGIQTERFPFAYHRRPRRSEKQFRKVYPNADFFNPAYGYYINYLALKGIVLQPVFGINSDERALDAVQQARPNAKVYPINCTDLSMEGGLVNCVTWDINGD